MPPYGAGIAKCVVPIPMNVSYLGFLLRILPLDRRWVPIVYIVGSYTISFFLGFNNFLRALMEWGKEEAQ